VQERVRGLLAYSSLAHMGFVLLALSMMNQAGYEAAMLYTLGYALSLLTLFLLFSGLRVNGRSIVLLEDIKGLASVQPILACCILIVCFSMLGLPPFAGFMLKMRVMTVFIAQQQILLAVLSLLPMAIAAYYYINIVHMMYFCEQNEELQMQSQYTGLQSWLLLLTSLLLLGIGLYPQPLFAMVTAIFR